MDDFACIEGKLGTEKFKHLVRSFLIEKQIGEPTLITPSAEARTVLMSFNTQNDFAPDGPSLGRSDFAYNYESVLGRHGPWFVMEINKISDQVREYITDENIMLATRDVMNHEMDGGEI
jgi:hypothetical protein